MSLDRSLKSAGALDGRRSVMTRAERVLALKADKRLDPKKDSALGLPKTKVPEK
ncbi:MAG: small basic protein [Phycisphaerae bacterium]|nr:small basic protein [Phycisphaerae bacterium]